MIRRIALPLAGLLIVVGLVGLYLGLRATPPSETEIITAQAARYVAETGGAPTDCYGVPSGVEGVRLVVICEAEGAEAWFAAIGPAGELLDPGAFDAELGA
ncbi:hypothetical protein V8J82_03410 [Gymnodinialimonas sp. 2305UL16-5]|uniref:hypothetical protein n=1 Tax=Gymnodinialimonas mytili TaxID=3126503 RepID=UPI003094A612